MPFCGLEIHHAVVIAPIELAGRDFDGRPHHPVAEHIHADLRGGLVIAFPLVLGRIRFPEIDGAVGEDDCGVGGGG